MKDNFSRQADFYAKYRPAYPPSLFEFILTYTLRRGIAWDCATGNGQSAKELAKHFDKVLATDISQKQIDNAVQLPNVFYSIQPAERTDFEENTFDLITVSQALHWFRFDDFYAEVRRVARPQAILAAWSYALLFISPEIDKRVLGFYHGVVGPYWDAERQYVDEGYKTIPFPFEEIATPAFAMEYDWTIDELEGYFTTWSAVQKFIAANGYNPVPAVISDIRPLWENASMRVSFPLRLRIGIIEK